MASVDTAATSVSTLVDGDGAALVSEARTTLASLNRSIAAVEKATTQDLPAIISDLRGSLVTVNQTIDQDTAILVVEGVCTHLGCSPVFRKDVAPADLGPDWLGGFFCPCHGSKFDLAGRVYKHLPAPTNLVVPPHKYLSDNLLLIGSDRKESV